ncbi:MAG: bifunctional diaminohydroxyphosphoribosylaminopyrimidine deaminase/5-amino-6-(5-phosphoribosylamino)uracil reductase RibD [Candidatus Aminicenantia bacterium]
MKNLSDINYLKMALFLAEKAKGWTSPNPCVGTVITQEGNILGVGFHQGPGKPHAESVAIEQAEEELSGSTLYVNLEPCVHWGRTPPCTEKIIQAGIKRVVISTLDPNPLVNQKGVGKLKEAGIEVEVGLLKEEAERLNEIYFKYITQKIPYLAVKAAVSLDGKIATKKFNSKWISSPQTREYTHLLRGEFDAIMVGINTIIQDNPQLTVRHSNWPNKRIKRIILDSRLRFPLQAKILSTLAQGEIIIYTLENSISEKAKFLKQKGVEIVTVSQKSGKVDLNQVLIDLGRKEISSVLVEGGGQVFSTVLSERLTDKIFLFISPIIIGGEKAPSFFKSERIEYLKQVYRLKNINYFTIESDIIVEGYL